MRAPVYRNVEARTTLLGLAFPTEVVLVLAVFWGSMLTLAPSLAAAVTTVAYAGVRALNHGRAPAFLQHWLGWRARQAISGGRLSAAARGHAPRFPFGPYHDRDAPTAGRQ